MARDNRTNKQLLAALTAQVEEQQASLDKLVSFVTELEEYLAVLKQTP